MNRSLIVKIIPMPEVVVPTARADVSTAKPERYAKQLVEHLGHRLTVEPVEGGQRLVFDGGSCDVLPSSPDTSIPDTSGPDTSSPDTGILDTGSPDTNGPDPAGQATLVLLATAVDAAGLDRVTDVVGRHLERFGQRAELVVTWQRDS